MVHKRCATSETENVVLEEEFKLGLKTESFSAKFFILFRARFSRGSLPTLLVPLGTVIVAVGVIIVGVWFCECVGLVWWLLAKLSDEKSGGAIRAGSVMARAVCGFPG